MGRYKDYHREPKGGGYDDDQKSDGRASWGRPSYASPSAPQASQPVEATVKWFNAEKGFGFVALDGGSQAFMHIRQLETAGHSRVTEGARVKVRIGQGQKGPEVTEVIEVDTSTARTASATERRPVIVSQVVGQTREITGTVNMYKADKGFGFVGQDGGGKDVFVHVTALARAGLTALAKGQRVRMKIGQGQKGLEAQTIELLD
jgi:CspA family cold shock protein